MKDLILTSGPAGTFGIMAVLLAPYMDRRIHEVTSAVAGLGDVELNRTERCTQVRALLPAKLPGPRPAVGRRRRSGSGAAPSPFRREVESVGCRQLRSDLRRRGRCRGTEQRPNEVLQALWKQLRPHQQSTPIPGNATPREVWVADYLPD